MLGYLLDLITFESSSNLDDSMSLQFHVAFQLFPSTEPHQCPKVRKKLLLSFYIYKYIYRYLLYFSLSNLYKFFFLLNNYYFLLNSCSQYLLEALAFQLLQLFWTFRPPFFGEATTSACRNGDPLVPGSTRGQDVKHKGVA